MKKFAKINNGIVENVVMMSDTYNGNPTAVSALLSGNYVQISSSTGEASIGGLYINNKFRPAAPFPSWTYNSSTEQFDPPVAKPSSGDTIWDETYLSWFAIATDGTYDTSSPLVTHTPPAPTVTSRLEKIDALTSRIKYLEST